MSPSNGASNASDFQPTTQNPQNIPSNIFQQQGGVQSVTNTQELLNDQQGATISITRAPAAPAPQAATAKETPVGFILLLFVIAAALVYTYQRRVKNAPRITETASVSLSEADAPQEQAEEASRPLKKTKPAAAKKKSAKKTKRKRR